MPTPFITLTKRADFLRLNRGRKFVTPYFILRSADTPQGGEHARVGYTVTTKCGNAVVRNRSKRRLRALVRESMPVLGKPGKDYVFIALAHAEIPLAEAPFEMLRDAMKRALSSV